LHKKYSHYSGVIVDILYDHFLAKNWTQYHSIPLHKYTENFYNLINSNFDRLTPRIQKMMPYMIEQNWLLSYASIDGIGKILDQMNRRTNNQSKMNLAVIELTKYYKEFEEEFTLFFEDLKKYSKNKITELKRL
jgi:acyl carrier protein phosphodiesterase